MDQENGIVRVMDWIKVEKLVAVMKDISGIKERRKIKFHASCRLMMNLCRKVALL